MTRVVFDATLIAQLQSLSTLTEVCDESGRTLGHFYPAMSSDDRAAVRSPFSGEELERLRQQRSGRGLTEILDDLGAP